MNRDDVIKAMAKDVARALWYEEPERPFTDEAWERELKWWCDAKEDGRAHPAGDVSHMWFAAKCHLIATAALSALEAMGIALVPVEADAKMLRCGASAYDHPSAYMGGPSAQGQRTSAKIWKSMLAASPLRQGDRPVSPPDGGSLEPNKEADVA